MARLSPANKAVFRRARRSRIRADALLWDITPAQVVEDEKVWMRREQPDSAAGWPLTMGTESHPDTSLVAGGWGSGQPWIPAPGDGVPGDGGWGSGAGWEHLPILTTATADWGAWAAAASTGGAATTGP